MKMPNGRLFDQHSREFKDLVSSADEELRATGIVRDRRDDAGNTHRGVVSGQELVQWMVGSHHCETRLQATQVASFMMQQGCLYSPVGATHFSGDANALFRIRVPTSRRLKKVGSKLFGRERSAPARPTDNFTVGLFDPSTGPEVMDDSDDDPWRAVPVRRQSMLQLRAMPTAPSARSSMELVRAMIPGYDDRQRDRQLRRQVKMNTEHNRSKVSRETQLRVLVASESNDLAEGSSQDTSNELPKDEDYGFDFAETPGFTRGRSKITFSETVHIREINDAKPKEYKKYMDPDAQEPRAVQFVISPRKPSYGLE